MNKICYFCKISSVNNPGTLGAQWLSGRVLDSDQKQRVQALPALLHCVIEQDTFIIA